MITRSADHHYTYEGKTYPGVTGILRIIDKSDALMSWAARQTAEAAVAFMEADGGRTMLDTVGPEGIIKALTSRSNWTKDKAASLGTDVHAWAELVTRGDTLPPLPEHVRGHVLNYLDWWKSSGWTLRVSEALLVNTEMGYGGTLDLLARDRDGKTVLADIKTGKAIYSEAVLQLTAYGMAEVIQAELPSRKTFRMPPIDRYVLLHVTASEVREVEITVGSLEREAWAAAIKLAEWRDGMKGKRL